ncbi:MAG TPA: helix-turn-helix domain-containing protein [Ktedonobacterales bacterium]
MSGSGPVTVRELLDVLRRWQARPLAGAAGLDRPVTWVATMRARLPAFEGLQRGELALISLPVLRALRAQLVSLSLPAAVAQLADQGVAAIALGGLPEDTPLPRDEALALDAARALADERAVPLLALPGTYLGEVEQALILHLMARREQQPRATAEPGPTETARLRESLRAEALDALLSGTYASEEAMRARAAQLGYDLTRPHAVLLIDLAPQLQPSGGIESPAAGQPGALASAASDPATLRLADQIATTLGGWVRIPSDARVEALLALGRFERGAAELAERVAALVPRVLSARGGRERVGRWAAGLGEAATVPGQVHRSAAEARDAARLGLLVLGPGHVARPADLGVYRLLLALRETAALGPFVTQTLAPLLADRRNGDALIQTLDVFFACNGNLSAAARQLHLHRNSLLYRLHRARELLGHDLDDPELRLALQLAIKGRRVLDL